jgi:alkylated DNA repair dioxygenase AlkB
MTGMHTPPIILKEGFVPAPDWLFRHLMSTVTWDERMRARKTASFGVSYDYSQMSYPASPMPPELNQLCGMIAAVLGFYPNNCLLNYYPDGESSMGFHSDSSEELVPGTGVAIVSLGAERAMIYRLKADKSVEATVMLPNGSLLFMSDSMQQDWLHAIPKAPGSPPRVSVTFREIVK